MSGGHVELQLSELLAAPLANGRSVPSRAGGFPVLKLSALRTATADLTEAKEGDWDEVEARPFCVAEGDFLVSRGNGSLRLLAKGSLVGSKPAKVAFPDTMIRIRARDDLIRPEYLALTWQSPAVRTQIEAAARTTAGIYKINQGSLGGIRVHVPSLKRQDEVLDAVQPQLLQLEELLLQSARLATRTELVEDVILRHAFLPDLAAKRDLLNALGTAPLPTGWCWRQLSELADIAGGVTKDSKRATESSVEVPYLRVANVQRGRLDLTEVKTIAVAPEKAVALRLQFGDVLMNEGGDRDKLGRGWVWEDQIPGCIHQNHVFRVRLHGELLPELLSWYGNSCGRLWFEQQGAQTTNLASISKAKLSRLPVPVPSAAVQESLRDLLQTQLDLLAPARQSAARLLRQAAALRSSIVAAATTPEHGRGGPQ